MRLSREHPTALFDSSLTTAVRRTQLPELNTFPSDFKYTRTI